MSEVPVAKRMHSRGRSSAQPCESMAGRGSSDTSSKGVIGLDAGVD